MCSFVTTAIEPASQADPRSGRSAATLTPGVQDTRPPRCAQLVRRFLGCEPRLVLTRVTQRTFPDRTRGGAPSLPAPRSTTTTEVSA